MLRASVWILMLTLIDKEVLEVTGESVGITEDFYGGRKIFLGLYSGNASDNLTVFNKPNDSLLCYNFTKGNSTTEQCKYYGDCCVDPMRIRDRLEPGTFSCQITPGYTGELVYVVDKCPRLTYDRKLISSCKQTNTQNSLSIATWPVTAKRTGVLYRNIFCAICHGVLSERDASAVVNYSASVDFWWLSVNCDNETIIKLTKEYESFSMEDLKPLITNSKCGLRFSPPSQPHRCLDAVRSCPYNLTDVELKLMCEQGPVSYTRAQDGIMYRNYFCQMCHGVQDDDWEITTEDRGVTTEEDVIDCGPEVHTGTNGSFTSPNYPNKYPDNSYCNWTITLAPGGRIGVRLLNFELTDYCGYDSLTFYDLTTGAHLETICGSGTIFMERNSSSVLVVFRTDGSGSLNGFELEWAELSCEFMGKRCSHGCEGGSYERPDLPCHGGTEKMCCEDDESYIDCGPEAHTGRNGSFNSPNYPDNYPNNAYCNWTITMPLGERIGIRLDDFDVEGEIDNCLYDWLKFYDLTTGAHLDTLCGSGIRYMDGNSSSVLVVFSTDGSVAHSGFQLEWAALSCEFMGKMCSESGCDPGSYERPDLPCDDGRKETCCARNDLETTTVIQPPTTEEVIDCGPEAHSGGNGSFTSPNYPNDYPNNAYCNWTITLPMGGVVGIRITNLELEEHSDCAFDYLKLYDLTTGSHLDTLCGSGARYVEGTSSSVLVVFKTDVSAARSGFRLEWTDASRGVDYANRTVIATGVCDYTKEEEVARPNTTEEEFKWLYTLVTLRPNLQSEHHKSISTDDYLTGILPRSTMRMALSNHLSDSYEYCFKPYDPPTNSSWDLGSLLCDSLYKGICDNLITRPRSGCGGPGCGIDTWQDTDNTCFELSDYTYSPSSREQAEYVWPHSLYGRYSSSCDSNVDGKGINCRCDSRCHYFDECCFDTPLPVDFNPPLQPLRYSCVGPDQCLRRFVYGESLPYFHYAIISACPTGSDMDLTQLCHQGEIGDWSPVGWTVYDSHTKLSYKNVYCALCNGVSPERVKFWRAYFDCPQVWFQDFGDEFYSHEWSGKCSFLRFIPSDPDIVYPCYGPSIISSCPHHLANWKVSADCVNEPTSWVFINETLYRNAYCAICNSRNDEIMNAELTLYEVYFVLGAESGDDLYKDHVYRPHDSLILDVSENKCCYNNECIPNTHVLSDQSPWGKIGLGNSSKCLTRLPFNTTCETVNFNSLITERPSITSLCSGTIIPTSITNPDGCVKSPVQKNPVVPDIPSFANLIFTDFGDIPLTQTFSRDTDWLETNESVLLCSNGTNHIPITGAQYSKLRLSPTVIEVKEQIVQKSLKQPSLEVYDYILLSLSLFSLSVYIIYIFIKKRRRCLNAPDLMKLSVLISLFGALLCYSVANIPVGRDLIGCQVLAAIQQYLFLSTFTWTSALAINITQIIYTMRPLLTSTKRYLCFAVYAVGVPLMLVVGTFILSMYEESITDFHSPVFREYGICFLHEKYVIYFLFLAPIYVMVTSNVILCVICMVRVNKTTGMTTNDKNRRKKNIITCIKLSASLGLGWVLLFFVLFFPETDSVVVTFQVFLELHGLLVVATNLISWKCVRGHQKRFISSTSSNSNIGTRSVELTNRSNNTP